jgi:hypothetical protein
MKAQSFLLLGQGFEVEFGDGSTAKRPLGQRKKSMTFNNRQAKYYNIRLIKRGSGCLLELREYETSGRLERSKISSVRLT